MFWSVWTIVFMFGFLVLAAGLLWLGYAAISGAYAPEKIAATCVAGVGIIIMIPAGIADSNNTAAQQAKQDVWCTQMGGQVVKNYCVKGDYEVIKFGACPLGYNTTVLPRQESTTTRYTLCSEGPAVQE